MHMAVALLLVLAAGPGGDAKKSQELAKRSIREYDLGQLDAALHDVEEAYLLDPVPALLFNVGQCHRALEHWKDAERAFRNYLRYRPNAPNREVVEQLIDEMVEKERTAVARPPPVAAPVVIREPPPPVAAPVAPPAPRAATTAPPPPPATEATASTQEAGHSHVLSICLGVGTLAAAGVSIWGLAQVLNFQSLQSQSQRLPGTVPVAQAQSSQQNAQTGQIVGFVAVAAAAGLLLGTIFTW